MTDRELLELAAKAAGIELQWETPFVAIGDFAQFPHNAETGDRWDALTDDGDALRLAVKLRFTVITLSDSVEVNTYDSCHCGQEMTCDGQDPYAATRRAIVRAAAEIGKEMK